ncbi:hypothetical protein PsorP6_007217 [Peronosclerospora sorghi]|uniref:Uncharacterized protein n=1 Tax=Peronosclerospora sorghi TaxID=230839 RepID=A0ACC0W716_9STRA|nr:hypothetical protein PsorP6_007217 [Peronosclerospora sorghi]
MRSSSFVIVALMIHLGSGVSGNPSSDFVAQVSSERDHTRAYTDENRFLRQETTQSKPNEVESESDEEEREAFISFFSQKKYKRQFELHRTPAQYREEELGISGVISSINPFKNSMYSGYVIYYLHHCNLIAEGKRPKFCEGAKYL